MIGRLTFSSILIKQRLQNLSFILSVFKYYLRLKRVRLIVDSEILELSYPVKIDLLRLSHSSKKNGINHT